MTEVDGRMEVIDLKIDAVRETVAVARQSAVDLFRSTIAVDYRSESQESFTDLGLEPRARRAQLER